MPERRCESCQASPARLYLSGWCCPDHTPARRAGRPEPPETGRRWWIRDGVEIPPAPLSASWLTDQRAIASGRRRASVTRWRDARAAEDARKQRERDHRRRKPTPERVV